MNYIAGAILASSFLFAGVYLIVNNFFWTGVFLLFCASSTRVIVTKTDK